MNTIIYSRAALLTCFKEKQLQGQVWLNTDDLDSATKDIHKVIFYDEHYTSALNIDINLS